MTSSLTRKLLKWHQEYGRHNLPWNLTKDPYAIWVSEVVLQQTRVEQGLPYYNRLLEAFPNVFALAKASEAQVLKLWEGLGYYSRGRNLHKGAKYVIEHHNGTLPESKELLLKIPGIGPYTSSAIASLAFNLPHGVVDGNVYRIVTRVMGIFDSIQERETQLNIQERVQDLLPKNDSATFNRAMMDFGATVCTPKKPKCTSCPLSTMCYAFQNERQKELPYKHKRLKKKNRQIVVLLELNPKGSLATVHRKEMDIWKGLDFLPEVNIVEHTNAHLIGTLSHQLTHLNLTLHFYSKTRNLDGPQWRKAIRAALEEKTFPVAISKFLKRQL